jgi:hypothetical protein
MTRPWILIFAAATLLASGCSKAPEPPPAATPDEAVEVKPAETKTIAKPEAKLAVTEGAKAAVAKATPTPAAKKPASKLVAWDAPIAWLDWDAGLAKAKAEKKAIMLLVFADW